MHEVARIIASAIGVKFSSVGTSSNTPAHKDNVVRIDSKEKLDVAVLQMAAFAKGGGGIIQRRKKNPEIKVVPEKQRG